MRGGHRDGCAGYFSHRRGRSLACSAISENIPQIYLFRFPLSALHNSQYVVQYYCTVLYVD